MADVSHELGALRFVVESPLSSKVAMFNNQVQQHKQSQSLNPFSQSGSRASSPKPTFSKDEYGKPLAGSLTEMRGQKANMHVLKEMLELCQIISSEGYDCKDEPTMRVIPFGELFNIYNYISDKVVGILLRARKHKLVDFEGEMLYQRRDDNVPIFLLKPILEIRRELESKIDDIKRGTSPAPLSTSVLLDRSAQNRPDLSVPNSTRNSKSRSSSPKVEKKQITPTKIEIEAVIDSLSKLNEAKSTEDSHNKAEIVAKATTTIVNGNIGIANSDQEIVINEKLVNDNTINLEVNANVTDAAVGQTTTEVAAAMVDAVAANKIDENNNNNNVGIPNVETTAVANTTINATDEIPTIVIEASAVYERRPSAPAESGEPTAATTTITATPTPTETATATATPPSS